MIGTDWEILLYASYTSLADKWELSHKRLLVMRKYINERKLSVSTRTDMLNKIGARQLREAFVVPALVVDKRGRFFTELTFYKYFRKYYEKNNTDIDFVHIQGNVTRGCLPSEETTAELIRRTHSHFKLYAERYYVPAIWELNNLKY